MADERLTAEELTDAWPALALDERIEGFQSLDRAEADAFFTALSTREQAELLLAMQPRERRLWFRTLAPDDAADLVQAAPSEERDGLLGLLDEPTRRELTALLAYAEDAAGGLMSPRFARLRAEMTSGEALRYLQAQEQVETIYYAYVLDQAQKLRGVVSLRELVAAPAGKPLSEIMHGDVITVPETMDQEAVAQIMAAQDLTAVPVVDAEGRMKGIVTIDDIVDVVQQEATEDMHKLGGMEALDTSYMHTRLGAMIKKRAPWLCVLFLGEMLTASAMSRYEHQIAQAVVLALFVPLIISSGGNSGSQASTLIIRAMALGEVALRDWWRIVRRELMTGLALGAMLAVIGVARIVIWEELFQAYGPSYLAVATTVGVSLMGVVTWGTLAGSTLPLLIHRLGFDPASASAPFVATLVDVSGLLIYFNVAELTLRSTLG